MLAFMGALGSDLLVLACRGVAMQVVVSLGISLASGFTHCI